MVIAPVIGPNCRFLPTCSEYALEALQRHGAWRGLGLTLRRLGRCHPWGGAGFDPVPPAGERGQVGHQSHRTARCDRTE